jgi:hypothetical protein
LRQAAFLAHELLKQGGHGGIHLAFKRRLTALRLDSRLPTRSAESDGGGTLTADAAAAAGVLSVTGNRRQFFFEQPAQTASSTQSLSKHFIASETRFNGPDEY